MFLITLASCDSLSIFSGKNDEPKVQGNRIAVMEIAKKTSPDKEVSDVRPKLSPSVVNRDWPQVGGNAEHAMPHAKFAPLPKEIWTADIGRGSSGYFKLLASPVVSAGKIFALDARGIVSAFSASEGDRIWEFDTTPPDRSDRAMGGGLGVSGVALYVTTGFGEVLALKVNDGSVIWRKMVGKPLRAAPTIADDRVFAISMDNELTAISVKSGEILWHHNGIAESAKLMGSSSPAASGDSVVVAYSSGEIFNLRAQNGRVAWADLLAVPEQVGALPAIADIRGSPVMDRGRVYAVSHSGRMAAIDLRTGDRVWEADVGGVNTPVVSGDAVFLLTNNNELMALTKERGRIIWVSQLQRLEDPEDRDSKPVFWWGPVLAEERLWLTNSLGKLASFDTDDGGALGEIDVSKSFFIPPVLAGGIMYLVDDRGRLLALN